MEVVATLVAGILVALATAFFTSRFYVHQAKADLEKEFQGRFNERRWEIYTEFSDILLDFVHATTDKRVDRDMPKFLKRLREFIGKLWLVGSDEVVAALLVWRRIGSEDAAAAGSAGLVAIANILIAMRKDLGDTDTGMNARDILGTFINDIDKYVDEKGCLRKQPG